MMWISLTWRGNGSHTLFGLVEQWQRAAIVSSAQVWLLPEEVNEIAEYLDDKLEQYRDRRDDPPEGARRVRLAAFAFPSDKPRR